MDPTVLPITGGEVRFVTTGRIDGNFSVDGDPDALARRRSRIVDLPWHWMRQVHGPDVVEVTPESLRALSGVQADAAVTAHPGLALAVHTADCLPVVFWSDEGVIGVAHAGWRGLRAGVLQATVEAMRGLGADRIHHHVGPHIGAECYEFGEEDLQGLAERFGDRVRGTTTAGSAALDLDEVHRAALGCGPRGEGARFCTSCEPESWYSYRGRGEAARMATVVWRPGAAVAR